MPAAHALAQTREDIERTAAGLDADDLWAQPGGAASVGFHLRHVAGSIDRLLTYARGESLSNVQHAALAREEAPGEPGETAMALVQQAVAAIDRALSVIRATPVSALHESRAVGRAALPTTVLGLLFHIAEHTQRHTGQIVTTAKIIQGFRHEHEVR
jgi:uncharacterized damage-inducible protein DinB